MPITLPPLSRRRFLTTSLAAGASLLLPRLLLAEERPLDPHRLILLSDTHVAGDKAFQHVSKIKPWDTFSQAVAQITALPTRPGAILINGDCACIHGLPEDYTTLIEGLDLLRKSAPLHMILGNHDHRENFIKALPADDAKQKDEALSDRHVLLVETPRANLLLLDSLDQTNKTPGVLGEKQLAWLAKSLDARPDKPAIVFVHHDPDDPVKRGQNKISSLTDTPAFLELILARKQVKAYVYGHTHRWNHFVYGGVHFINLPPTAWTFDETRPRGWVDLALSPNGGTFQLKCLNPEHAKHNQKLELEWRA